MKFSSISVSNWRQFEHVALDLHPRLTVITGSNGTGKSTILNLFSHHFGAAKPFLATPKHNEDGTLFYDLGFHDPWETERNSDEKSDASKGPPEPPPGQFGPPAFRNIGSVTYDDNTSSPIGYYDQQTNAFGMSFTAQKNVDGIRIDSHRTMSPYQQVQNFSFQYLSLPNAYAVYANELNIRLHGGRSEYSPIYQMKATLVAMAAFGEGNSHVAGNAQLVRAFNGFVKILKKVLPNDVGFKGIAIRLPEVVIETRSGEFLIDSSSGGISAIIEIVWQIYLYSLNVRKFVVVIDEPENHLHPSMQRSIIANFVAAFPNVQFIVATHSPFVVSAVEDSYVYALRYRGRVGPTGLPKRGPRRVYSDRLDQARKSGTANDILREVLGLTSTIPDWAQEKIDLIVSNYSETTVDVESLGKLRRDLADAGFSEFYPEALSKLVDAQ